MSDVTKAIVIPSELDTAAAEQLIKFYAVNVKSAFERAKVITKQLGREGVTAEGFAKALSNLRIAQRFPSLELADAIAAHDLLNSREKVSVTGQTLRNYKLSWESVVDAGIIPNVETVDAAYKVISRGKWAKVRKTFEEGVAALKAEKREEAYLTGMTAANMIELDSHREATVRKSNGTAEHVDEDLSPAHSEPSIPLTDAGLSVAVVDGFLEAVSAHAWTPEELAEVLATLAGTVEVLTANMAELAAA